MATLRVSFSRNPLVLRFKFESSHLQLYSFEKKDKPFGNVLENSTNLRLYMNAGLVGPIKKKACIEFLEHLKCM